MRVGWHLRNVVSYEVVSSLPKPQIVLYPKSGMMMMRLVVFTLPEHSGTCVYKYIVNR